MKYAVLFFAVCLSSVVLAGEGLLTVENFRKHSNGSLEIVVKFTNDTGRTVSLALGSCAFFNKNDKAVTTQPVAVQNVPAGSVGYGSAFVMSPDDAEKANCRLTSVD
jgi:hypothetical protein